MLDPPDRPRQAYDALALSVHTSCGLQGGRPSCRTNDAPRSPPGTNWSAIAVGGRSLCAHAESGRVTCEGDRSAPNGKWAGVAAGEGFVCVWDADGVVACSGPAAPEAPLEAKLTDLVASWTNLCGTTAAGAIHCPLGSLPPPPDAPL